MISLRDHFAGLAMQALISSNLKLMPNEYEIKMRMTEGDILARRSYAMAEYMIKNSK